MNPERAKRAMNEKMCIEKEAGAFETDCLTKHELRFANSEGMKREIQRVLRITGNSA